MANGSPEVCAEHVWVVLWGLPAYYGRNLREPGIPTEQVGAEAGEEEDSLVYLILFLSCVWWGLGDISKTFLKGENISNKQDKTTSSR